MSVIASILAFHILICAHELGHYFAARSVGLRAIRVSIGIGPTIISWLHSGTEYRFALLPFGGYVSFTSQRSGTGFNLLKELSRAKRIWVIVAGPLANFLLPMVIYGSLLISGEAVILGMKTVPTTQVAAIGADMHQSHVRVGDLILSINGRTVTSYAEVVEAVSRAKSTVKMLIARPTTQEHITYRSTTTKTANLWRRYPTATEAAPKITLTWPDRIAAQRALASIELRPSNWITNNVFVGLKIAFNESILVLTAMKGIVSDWLSGHSEPEFHSVVSMTKMSMKTYERGLAWFLSIFALFSLNLFVLNLLPLPGLDGGQLCAETVEFVAGRSLPSKLKTIVHATGLLLLLMFVIGLALWEIYEVLVES